jgi:serine/threonine-protein kinase
MQICDVLAYLHGKGIIYRDMKPSNVMIDSSDGKIKLVDFGIAKIFKPTERGTQIGTPGYAPPEQYQGLATPVSDIYALAATLHHLLTGRDPTEQPPFSFPPARDVTISVSRRTSDVLERALKQNMQDRIQTISEFRSLLRPTINFSPVQVRVAANTATLQPSSAAAGSIQQHNASTVPAAAPDASTVSAPAPTAPASARQQIPPPAAPPASGQQQAGQQQKASRGGFASVLLYAAVALLVVVLLGGGVVFYLSMMAASPQQPAAPVLQPVSPLPLQVEAEVPAGPGNAPPEDQVILEALRQAYRDEIEQAYPGAEINSNSSITMVGAPEQVAATGSGSTLRYRATMQGFVALPE